MELKNDDREWLKPSESLTQRTVRGGVWVFALNLSSRGLRLISTIILARLLLPSDFGLVGIALIAISALELFTRTGFDAALIQKKGAATEYLDTTWLVSAIRGMVLAVILFSLSPIIARFFENAEAAPILRVMAITTALVGFRNIGVMYFRKELRFEKQFIFNLGITLTTISVSIPLAFLLRSVWAIIYGALAGSLMELILSYVLHPYRPKFKFDSGKAKELFSFGKWILGSGVLVFLVTQGDDIFVGKLLGVTLLGLYQIAYRISNLPATEITHVISRVTFPAFSKLQDNKAKLREGYLKVLQLTSFILFPLAGGIFILAPDFTQIFLGSKWMPMVPAMQVLAFAGLVRAVGVTTGPVFLATGKPEVDTRWQIIRLLVLAALIYPLAIRWEILGVSLAVLLSILVPTLGFSFRVIKITECRIVEFIKRIVFPLIGGAIMVLSISILKNYIKTVRIWEFFLFIGVGITVYLGLAFLSDRFLNYRVRMLFKEILNSLKGT